MTFFEYVKELLTTPSVIIFGAITLFEVVPIKINPWTALFKWIGNTINKDTQIEIDKLSKQVSELKIDFEEKKANDMRCEILNFSNSCRRGNKHSKDEWWHIISQIAEYEDYTYRKNIENGVIEEDSRYLRELYHERNVKNDFLQGGIYHG